MNGSTLFGGRDSFIWSAAALSNTLLWYTSCQVPLNSLNIGKAVIKSRRNEVSVLFRAPDFAARTINFFFLLSRMFEFSRGAAVSYIYKRYDWS